MTDLVEGIFEMSFREFLDQERANIINDVSERNLCGRLAMYLDRFVSNVGLKGYYVDPEYNRKQNGEIKTILDDKMQVIVINCDLILHSRGEIVARDNLIAIEMKKSNRPEIEKSQDRSRLRAMTKASYDGIWSNDGVTNPKHVCGYELGVFIELAPKKKGFRVEKFRGGEFIGEYSGTL